MKIESILIINTDIPQEPVIEGYKPIATTIEELEHSRVIQYLSYIGGIKLQVAMQKFKEAQKIVEDQELAGDPAEEIKNPEDMLTEEEKSLIYAAYMMT